MDQWRVTPDRLGKAAAATVAIVLGGCAGATVIDHVYYYPSYDRGLAEYVLQDRDVATEILGPKPGPSPAWTNALLGAMNRSGAWGIKTNFTLTPKNARANYRVVMLIDPERLTTGDALCSARAVTAPPEGSAPGLRLYAALCYREDALAEASGASAAVLTPGDPAFLALVNQMMIAVFPPPSRFPDCLPVQRMICFDGDGESGVHMG
ncbi:MAG: hypothetical protein EXQ96_01580 [Alphaproteobacteria bacterium]|nr:hypothetical protein [Alphaproteobacteria bacterium]